MINCEVNLSSTQYRLKRHELVHYSWDYDSKHDTSGCSFYRSFSYKLNSLIKFLIPTTTVLTHIHSPSILYQDELCKILLLKFMCGSLPPKVLLLDIPDFRILTVTDSYLTREEDYLLKIFKYLGFENYVNV